MLAKDPGNFEREDVDRVTMIFRPQHWHLANAQAFHIVAETIEPFQ